MPVTSLLQCDLRVWAPDKSSSWSGIHICGSGKKKRFVFARVHLGRTNAGNIYRFNGSTKSGCPDQKSKNYCLIGWMYPSDLGQWLLEELRELIRTLCVGDSYQQLEDQDPARLYPCLPFSHWCRTSQTSGFGQRNPSGIGMRW